MNRRSVLAVLVSSIALSTRAAFAAAPPGEPTATEKPFVDAVTGDLRTRFATVEAARRAGYLRYTDEDETGAISYANRQWTSTDARHPSQLWYDARGRLIGADFSVPFGDRRPKLFGVDPARWNSFNAHVHYGLARPGGTVAFGATSAKTLATADSSVEPPTAAALVAAGIAKRSSDVRFVFTFPAIWDLGVWLIPNPSGAFADKNPDVRPANGRAMPM